jgi:hypothetical protein
VFDYNSDFTETKDLALVIVTECDAITFAIILLKKCEHPSLPGYMIGASTI